MSTQNPQDILCLGARYGDLSETLNTLESRFSSIFNKQTIYASISDHDSIRATEPNEHTAIFTTFDSSKGLERKIRVIFDFTESYWNARISKHAISSYYEPSVISPRPAGIPALKGELSKFTVGAKVNHTGFGKGTILQINSLNGSHFIDVKFDNRGTRKLLLEMVVRSGMLQLVTEDTAEPVEPEKPAKDPKQEQYELGYEDVKDLFTQQTRIICDRYKTRWVK